MRNRTTKSHKTTQAIHDGLTHFQVAIEPETEPELVIEWMLPGGAVVSPFVTFGVVGPLGATWLSVLPIKEGGGRISFLPFVL